jgi:hypothetical protein
VIRYLTILLCLITSAAAQERKTSTIEQYHFLFVVDTSISMAPRKAVAIQMMRELIASGFVGQAETGDSVDIWLYDQENDISRFPPQIWEETDRARIADVAARFIEKQPFNGRSRFAAVAGDLEALLPNTKKLLVIILTDGEEPLSGISPDIEINEYVGKLKHAILPGHPFVISLAALHGRFGRWAVYNGDGRDDLASLPRRPLPKSLVAKAAAKPAAKPPEKKPEPVKPAEKKVEDQPIIFSLPPGARLANPAPEPAPAAVIKTPQSIPTQPSATEGQRANTELASKVAATNSPTHPAQTTSSNSPASVATPHLVQRPAVTPPAATLAQAQPKPPAVAANAPQNPKSATNEVKLHAASNAVAVAAGRKSPTNEAAVIAKPSAPKTPPPAQPPSPILTTTPIPTAAILGGLALAGLAVTALGGLLFLKRAKARQDGSIISQSLLR